MAQRGGLWRWVQELNSGLYGPEPTKLTSWPLPIEIVATISMLLPHHNPNRQYCLRLFATTYYFRIQLSPVLPPNGLQQRACAFLYLDINMYTRNWRRPLDLSSSFDQKQTSPSLKNFFMTRYDGDAGFGFFLSSDAWSFFIHGFAPFLPPDSLKRGSWWRCSELSSWKTRFSYL